MSPKIELEKIVGAIFLDRKFEFPVTLVMIGVKGYMVARFELATASEKSKVTTKFESTVLAGRAKDLRFPINVMFVDSLGRAAHIYIKRPDELGSLTFLPIEIEARPISWPKGYPEA